METVIPISIFILIIFSIIKIIFNFFRNKKKKDFEFNIYYLDKLTKTAEKRSKNPREVRGLAYIIFSMKNNNSGGDLN